MASAPRNAERTSDGAESSPERSPSASAGKDPTGRSPDAGSSRPEGEIAAADDPEAERARLVALYQEKFANPFVAAERGYIDEVIQPRLLRRKLISSFAMLETKRDSMPPKKHGNIPL